MRAIVGAQLGKDGLDSTLDGFFRNRELISDLLVEFPAAIKRNTLISAGVSVSSVAYSATAYDASGKRAFLPALNLSNRFHQFFMKRIL